MYANTGAATAHRHAAKQRGEPRIFAAAVSPVRFVRVPQSVKRAGENPVSADSTAITYTRPESFVAGCAANAMSLSVWPGILSAAYSNWSVIWRK